MDQSPLHTVFLASNDFCTSQKSKYGNINSSFNSHNNSILIDTTYNNKSHINPPMQINTTSKAFQEKNLMETSVPVKIKSLEREEYTTMLNLSIKTTAANNKPQQNLLLQITDENNLQFLQILNFTEQEF